MLRIFVLVTGALDVLLGIWIALPGVVQPQPATFLNAIMLGAFLVFCGVVLMWASKDLRARAFVVLWQGLVRATAVVAIFIGLKYGWVGRENLALAVTDLVIATVYFVGIARLLPVSPLRILIGQGG